MHEMQEQVSDRQTGNSTLGKEGNQLAPSIGTGLGSVPGADTMKNAFAFSWLAVDVLKDMLADWKWLVQLGLVLAIFACFRMFYMTTPDWARWLVTIYFLHALLDLIGLAKKVPQHVLKAKYNAWMEAASSRPVGAGTTKPKLPKEVVECKK